MPIGDPWKRFFALYDCESWELLYKIYLYQKYAKYPVILFADNQAWRAKRKTLQWNKYIWDGACYEAGKKAVLTNGFIKKSQKTPKAEKELAKKYKADYERNKKSQPEYSEKTCTGIRDAIKAGICSDANQK